MGRAYTQQLDRSQQRNYLRQHMCAWDSRIPRLRRDYDGLAEQMDSLAAAIVDVETKLILTN